MKQREVGLLAFLLMTSLASAMSQDCSVRPPRLRVPRANIFNEEQEQALGDAQADMIEPRYTLLPETESAYLNEIGKKLLDQLPPTSVHYTFRVFESPDLRAFSMAGGHIYISRKLISDAHSEDELAAMLAQEIGRVYSRHSASVVTRRLGKLMRVKSIGDRADVYDKFERVLNIPPNSESELVPDERMHDELLADQVGLYAMVRAQYTPAAFASFLDRVNNNGGYTGNLFTDIFDDTPDISMRVRMAHKTVDSLPEGCRKPRPLYLPGFKPFQDAMSGRRIDPLIPPTPGLSSIPLVPPMNPALENVVLSPDGKYMLGQDHYQIHVAATSPPRFLFSVDALEAELAQFSPDSSSLVFNYNDLHIEKWQLATGKPADAVDYVDYAGCLQASLSPDGNALACISINGDSVWLKVEDVATGQMLYQNLHFSPYRPGVANSSATLTPPIQAFMRWTRDGKYFVAASGTDGMAYDVTRHGPVQLLNKLSGFSQERFAFVGSDKLVSTCDWGFKPGTPQDTYKMCFTTFPAGAPLGSFQLPRGWLGSVAAGDRLLFGPTNNSAAIVFDPAASTVIGRFKLETVDLARDEVAAEAPAGGISIGLLGGKMETVNLPATPLNALEASAFSLNGRYLAVSDRARGAEWDVSTGKQIALTEPFRSVAIDEQGKLQVQFVHHEIQPSSDTSAEKRTHKLTPYLARIGDPMQYGSIRLRFRPRGLQQSYSDNVDLEAIDAQSEARLWSTHFDYLVPAIVPADGDRLLFVMGRQTRTGYQEAGRIGKNLIRAADEIRELLDEKGMLIEVISNRTGVVEHALATPQLPSSRREERTAALFGTMVAVYGNSNNTVVYRVSDGARLLAFFGHALAGDDTLGMIAATNRPQELTIYSVATGKPLTSVILDQNVLAARFVPEDKQLLALTATQHVYRLDLRDLNK